MPDTTSTPVALHPGVEAVTRRIVERSAALHGLRLSLHNRAGGGLQAVLSRSHG